MSEFTHNHNHIHTTTNQPQFKFQPPDWNKMSIRQKMTYVQSEIKFVYGKLQSPKADVQYWRHQLSYFLWLPIKNALNPEEAKKQGSKKEEYISKGVSKFLFTLCEARIPLEKEGAMVALKKLYWRVTKMIEAYDQRAVNSLRNNIGLEPEANMRNLELFNQIFATEIQERKNKTA